MKRTNVSHATRKMAYNTTSAWDFEKNEPIEATVLKKCACCGELKPLSDYYVKSGQQRDAKGHDLHPANLTIENLREICIECYDADNGYNFMLDRKKRYTESENTLIDFITEAV